MIRQVKDHIEIEKILLSCKDDFYSDEVKRESVLQELAGKYYNSAIFIVAEDVLNICGFIAFYANNLNTCQAFISSIVVRRKYQHMGIGKQLLKLAEDISLAHGMKTIALEVDKTNQKAIDFYTKHNYVFISPDSKTMLKKL